MRSIHFLLLAATALAVPISATAEPVPYSQMKRPARSAAKTGAATIAQAHASALQRPRSTGYINANQVYAFGDGAIFQLFTAPDKVSDIALQPGEALVAISAGDTARWIIGDTYSGEGATKQVHVLVKPFAAGLTTNLVITTDRRTYHVQLESTPVTAMTAISWNYPQDALLAHQAQATKRDAEAPVAAGLSVEDLHFGYTITGDMPSWRPVRAFDDGQKVYIQFPPSLPQSEAPPLFLVGADGKAELVNYRLQRNHYVVDRLFDVAELRLGAKRQAIVRISRMETPAARAKSLPGIGGRQ